MRLPQSTLVFTLFAAFATETAAQWRVDPKPTVVIGAEQSGDDYLFTRVQSVARLSDGRIAVADGSMGIVRLFDASGKFVGNVGGKGRGPGEYRSPFWVGIGRADTLYVYDYAEGPGTLLQYAPTGRFIKSAFVSAMEDASAALPVALLRDGSLLLSGSVPSSYPRGKAQPYRGERGVIRFRFPATIANVMRIPGQIIEPGMKPWLVEGVAAIGDSVMFVGDGETPTVAVHDLDGKLLRRATLDIARRALTAQDKDGYVKRLQEIAASRPSSKESIERQIAETTYPPTFPAYIAFITDRTGNLWLALPNGLGMNRKGNDYLVFNAMLKQVARVSLPEGFSPREIGGDYILGTSSDADGVPLIRMHRLIK